MRALGAPCGAAAPCAARHRPRVHTRAIAEAPPATLADVEATLYSGQYAHELRVAVDAVREACAMCSKVQASIMLQAAAGVDLKVDRSLVTTADYAAQALISARLREAFGDGVQMVGEEDSAALRGGSEESEATLSRVVAAVNDSRAASGSRPLSANEVLAALDRGSGAGGRAGRHWVLDPVDGTLGFVRGDQYAVALALVDSGNLAVAALGCPNMPAVGDAYLTTPQGDSLSYGFSPAAVSKMLAGAAGAGEWHKGVLFCAAAGGGAWAAPTDAACSVAPARVAVSDEADPTKRRVTEPVLKENTSQGFSAAVAIAMGMGGSKPLRVYSMVKYGAVARGDAHVFMKFPKAGYKEKTWDHAAGVLIVQEAGGVVTDAGGNPLDFGAGRFLEGLDRGIIACAAGLHARLLTAVDGSWSSSQL